MMYPQIELPAEIAVLPRQQRRNWMRQKVKADAQQARVTRRPRQRRPRRIDLLAQFFPVAQAMMMSSDKATPPKFRAVVKMAKYLITSPLHRFSQRHQRGSWRSWPRGIGQEELKEMETKQ